MLGGGGVPGALAEILAVVVPVADLTEGEGAAGGVACDDAVRSRGPSCRSVRGWSGGKEEEGGWRGEEEEGGGGRWCRV